MVIPRSSCAWGVHNSGLGTEVLSGSLKTLDTSFISTGQVLLSVRHDEYFQRMVSVLRDAITSMHKGRGYSHPATLSCRQVVLAASDARV